MPQVERALPILRDETRDRVVVRRRPVARRVVARRVDARRPRFQKVVVVGGLLRPRLRLQLREVLEEVRVGGDVVLLVRIGPLRGDLERERVAVVVGVQRAPVPGRRGVDRLAREPGVGEQEGLVDGDALGRRDRHRVAVIEADVAEEVADLVVPERDPAAVLRMPVDPQARLVRAGGRGRLKVVDDDDGAVEEHLLRVRGADPQAVADGDLELDATLGVVAVADRDDVANALLPAEVVLAEDVLAHAERERAPFGVGAREDDGGPAGILPHEAPPVRGEPVDRRVRVPAEMEPPAVAVGGDRLAGPPVAERFRRGDLPRPERRPGLRRHGLVLGHDALPPGGRHLRRAPTRLVGLHAADMDQHVLGVGLLPAHGLDARAAHDVAGEAQAGSGLDRLELLGVAAEEDLGAGPLRQMHEMVDLARRQHAGLVDHDHGVAVDVELLTRRHLQHGRDRVRPRVDVGAERYGGPPCDGDRNDRPAMLAPQVRERPQRRRLPAPGRALDDVDAPVGARRRPDGGGLLPAQRVAPFAQGLQLVLDRRRGNAVPGVRLHPLRHVGDGALGLQGVARGPDPGVRQSGGGIDRRPGPERDQRRVEQDAPDRRLDGRRVDQTGAPVGDGLDDLRHPDHGLVLRELVRHGEERLRQRADLLRARCRVPLSARVADDPGNVWDDPGGFPEPTARSRPRGCRGWTCTCA